MAFVSKPSASITFDFTDSSGSKATTRGHVPAATTIAAALTAAASLGAALATATSCTLTSYSVTYSEVDNAPVAPAVNCRVEEKGVYIFRLANGLFTRIEVPGFGSAFLNPSGSIDLTEVQASGVSDSLIAAPWCGVDGSDITAVVSAYQRFRRSTKAMLPSDRSLF
jgi:hypothetical protein